MALYITNSQGIKKKVSGNYQRPLYSSTGQNTDGAMNQQAVTKELNKCYKDDNFNKLLNAIYPVGTIYIQAKVGTSTMPNPVELFGGDWVQLEDVVLKGAGKYNFGDTIGSDSKSLNTNNMPSHTHNFAFRVKNGKADIGRDYGPNSGGDHFCGQINNWVDVTNNSPDTNFGARVLANGSGTSFSIVQKSHIVKIWRRIA